MKLIRHGECGKERLGVLLDNGTRLYVSDFGSDYDELVFGQDGLTLLRAWLGDNAPSSAGII